MKKIIVVSAFVVLAFFIWIWSSYQQALDDTLTVEADGIDYSIKSGSSLSAVIYDLANKKIISHPRYLLWYARLNGLANKMKTGDYRLTSNLTTKEFLNDIFTGKVIQYSLTIIEGWSFQQLLEAINEHPHLKHTITELSRQEIMTELGLSVHYEGQFLPDTYYFPKQLTDIEFLKRAYHSMQDVLKNEWENRAVGLIYKNPYEALIMASIIEKETGQASEREQISGVFVRRLEKRMRLQTDPTVIYGMGDKYKGNIRKRDLLRDTPYNTYRRRGLPPTPIALPGKKAIHAALHPADGDALYFVARGDGSHVFSATLKEHNKAVIKYQLKGRVRSFSSYKHKNSN
ncbi:MAG: endolytic transglycosylase MltG [Gammaproteobacteria bacterium]|nr:MAG: endolytic transglycosylase MltG [Gammaproteobacteria bacterium]